MKKTVINKTVLVLFATFLILGISGRLQAHQDTLSVMQYTSRPMGSAIVWQEKVRSQLFDLMKLENLLAEKRNIALKPVEILSEDKGTYTLKEIEINSTPGRRIRVVVTFPKQTDEKLPAVVSIHGHGGKMYSVYDPNSPYKGFARELAENGYVTIAGFVSQHEVYEEGMLLMGERLWDLIRCVDYLETLDVVDNDRIGCAGLSLGGEMAMWLGAMDTRIKATVSAGFLTKMGHMEQNHCMCWKFPGLRHLVDFADIYSLTAPRPLQCQNGLKEPVPHFYVPIAREALREIQTIYWDYNRPENLMLDVHNEGHIVDVPALMWFMNKHLNNE